MVKEFIKENKKKLLITFIEISSIFILSRIVISLVLLFFSAGNFALDGNTHSINWENIHSIIAGRYDIIALIKKNLLTWDAGWYKHLVDGGYGYVKNSGANLSTAFYYGYPLTARLLKNILGVSTDSALLLASNGACYLSLFFIYYIGKLININKNARLIGLFLFAFNPFSIFLTAGYSESLYVLVSAATLVLLLKGEYLAAAVIGGFLGGIRSTGIFICPILFIYYFFISNKVFTTKKVLKGLALCALCTWGKAAFMLFNYFKFHELFASEIVQKYWGNVGVNLTLKQQLNNLMKFLAIPFLRRFNLLSPSVPSILMVYLLLIVSIISLYPIIKKFKSKAPMKLEDKAVNGTLLLIIWSLIQLILPLIIFGLKGNNPFSMGRYVLPMFPIYILLGKMLENKVLLYSILLILFILQMIIISIGYAFGLAHNVYVF